MAETQGPPRPVAGAPTPGQVEMDPLIAALLMQMQKPRDVTAYAGAAREQAEADELRRQLEDMTYKDRKSGGLFGWVGRRKRAKQRPEIEAKYQDALVEAMMAQAGVQSYEDQIEMLNNLAQHGIEADITGRTQAKYRAPSDMQRWLEGGEGTREDMTGFFRARRDPEQRMTVYGPDGSVLLEMGGGADDLTTGTKTQLEKNLSNMQEQVNGIRNMAGDFQAEYLTVGGNIQAKIGNLADRWNLPIGEAQKKFNAERSVFITSVLDRFNKYRKAITGAQASVQEIEFLKRALANEDMGPVEFRAVLEAELGRIHSRANEVRQERGLPLIPEDQFPKLEWSTSTVKDDQGDTWEVVQ